jgi:hypothetical protein
MIRIEMTGSPKPFGFKTKEQFIETLKPYGVFSYKLSPSCDFLITNDLSSNTLKMKLATQLGIKIMTYGGLIEHFKKEMRRKKLLELKDKIKKG